MRWLTAILIVVSTIALGLAGDKPNKDLEPFQGTWAVESITRDGDSVPEDDAQRLILVVKGNERFVKDGDVVSAPIEDDAKVDERRKEVGLPPLAEYLKQARKDRGLPDKK